MECLFVGVCIDQILFHMYVITYYGIIIQKSGGVT